MHLSNVKPCIDIYHCILSGSSMEPALRRGDLLEILPQQKNAVQVGDVVAFRTPDQRNLIIHRIVAQKAGEFRTRGDNSSSLDHLPLLEEDLVGTVVAAWRGQKRFMIRGGKIGLLLVKLSRLTNRIEQRFCSLFFPLYIALVRLWVFQKLLPRSLKPKVIVFNRNDREIYRLMLGNSLIGQYDNNTNCWQLRRLFPLFVNKLELFKPASDMARSPFQSVPLKTQDIPSIDP